MDTYAPCTPNASWATSTQLDSTTNSMSLRYFGGGEDTPEVAAAIRRADDAAIRLTESFAT
eukprot:CAMPEP_0196216860 /NCGR_PEP_ID=MMETSP0912-20130531/33161_1 /TAXON_ID=49265 /ORGANISM="Thalassiosira rotula, Strain GSO102" /LENGTH=60 /DNA_ID=CAMNT_0041494151 /DNA_START=81 /DNA_END=260 /DNA_ORIENTATION=+